MIYKWERSGGHLEYSDSVLGERGIEEEGDFQGFGGDECLGVCAR